MRPSGIRACVTALAFVAGSLTALPLAGAQTVDEDLAETPSPSRAAATTRPVHSWVQHRVSQGARPHTPHPTETATPTLVGPPAPVAALAPPAPVASPAPAPVAREAATPAPPSATPLSVRPSRPLAFAPESTSLDTGWKFLAVFALAAAALAYWKRQNPAVRLDLGPELRVVRRTSIGMRSELLVVDVDGQRYLLGVTPSSVQSLAVLDGDGASPKAPVHDEERARESGADTVARFEAMLESARAESSFAAPRSAREPAREPSRELARESVRESVRESAREPDRKRVQTATVRRVASTPPTYGDAVEEQARGLLALGARD